MNDMVDQRNNSINGFMDTLHELEKKRTSMIESCYKDHMLVIKRLSSDSFEKLYKKYLEVIITKLLYIIFYVRY